MPRKQTSSQEAAMLHLALLGEQILILQENNSHAHKHN
jgi:hypothetical protein